MRFRELSKLHEENVRGTVREVLTHFEKQHQEAKFCGSRRKTIVKEVKKSKFRRRITHE
jgi:16S rRNA (cytidine1402-2'-O)-methyltransferase